MSQHTPGPWYVGIDKVSVWGTTPKVGKEPTIAHCVEPLKSRVVREANARLIAAAPEMLEYLKTYAPLSCISGGAASSQEEHCRCSGCWARALLAKIEGKV